MDFKILLLALLTWSLACAAEAEEKTVLRFRETPACQGDVVHLRELVEVAAGKSSTIDRVLEMPMGPAPRAGAAQVWYSQDVLKHLELRGVHPASIRWTGSDQARLERVQSSEHQVMASMTPAFVQERTVRQAAELVEQALSEYLTLKTGERTDWRITAHIPTPHVSSMSSRRNIVGVGGGSEPWLGEQQFVIQVRYGDEVKNLSIMATVEFPPMIVAAKRPLRRDEVLTADALMYEALPKNSKADVEYFTDMDQVLGKQMRRSLSTGLPLSDEFLGDPIVVSRGEIVTIECVAGGITVSTQGRAMGGGAIGDLVEVEMAGRRKLLATISGPMKVRVAATSRPVTTAR
ncbi:flagellar basal body P-ring formation chaperone FlgA [Aureliella helgolandensis]|uniref:Flagellar basal body P-ring biosynthesis protein FlgA n=1 Tax=Aureliella helgolandensis TaxID=2527968 RepID=A0A518G8X4_9BACT|nr:flagellar basal body P-ring formation chaperone FlgA [Aureliella helgolandensis]QDV25054.1 flagellar basal body P-ring biosynthesis protein FlgA [Aureliella helgolandensis]